RSWQFAGTGGQTSIPSDGSESVPAVCRRLDPALAAPRPSCADVLGRWSISPWSCTWLPGGNNLSSHMVPAEGWMDGIFRKNDCHSSRDGIRAKRTTYDFAFPISQKRGKVVTVQRTGRSEGAWKPFRCAAPAGCTLT